MESTNKIDRPLVKMTRTNDDGDFDFDWYSTMIGKQGQLITLLEERLKIVKETLEISTSTNNILREHKDMLQRQVDENEHRVIIFQPWNIGKKKKNNVGD